MLIWGKRLTVLSKLKLKNEVCEHCGTKGSITLHIFSKHFHVYWVPFFPYGKEAASECDHCKQVLEDSDMSEAFERVYKREAQALSHKWWQYIGIILLACLISVGVYFAKLDAARNLKYIGAPQVGDVYRYKVDKDTYSMMKVTALYDGEVEIVSSDGWVAKRSDVIDLIEAESYLEKKKRMKLKELKALYDDNVIYRIDR